MVASGMNGKPDKPASPVCYIEEADDAYMGFASKAETAAFLAELAEAEQSGRPTDEMLRRMLPRIRDDELHQELSAKLKAQQDR
jgi:hypothetical protein